MEQNNFFSKLGKRFVIYLALAALIYGALAYFFAAPAARVLYQRQDNPVNILIVTDNPMYVSYNPKTKKALVTNINSPALKLTVSQIMEQARIPVTEEPPLVIAPANQTRAAFWDNFKDNLTLWPKKPYLVFVYIRDYVNLRLNGKTNITAADFTALSIDLAGLSAADFSVTNQEEPPKIKKTQKSKKKEESEAKSAAATGAAENKAENKKEPARQEAAAAKKQTRPLVVEVLNASGQKDLAAIVTKYIRTLANDGQLNVDVINYASFPSLQKETEIIDLSNRLEDVKQLSLRLGLGDKEIFLRKDANAISDCKIILGQDYRVTDEIKNIDSLPSK